MRIITVLTGLLFIIGGVYLITNTGVTFLSVAFVVGLMFIIAGIIECLSYAGYRGKNLDKSWVLIDGLTTFILGWLILQNKISAEAFVPMILGFWVIVTGIRNLVVAWEHVKKKTNFFYDHLIIGIVNLIYGIYVFFNSDLLNLTNIMIIGLCIVVQGMNLVNVGGTILLKKPEFIKTKQEKLDDASKKAVEAHLAAKEAIRAAKEAQTELRTVKAITGTDEEK